jgi:Flp pilus assembly protein TadD
MTSGPAPSRALRRQQWLEQVDAAQRRGDGAAAARLAEQALADGVEHPALFNLVAQARYEQGALAEAVALLRRARALAPADPHLLNGLGLCLRAQGRNDAALEAFSAAIRADRRHAAAEFNRAALLEELHDVTGARAGYQRAIELQPGYVEPLASLAWLLAQAGDAAQARAHGARAAALAPQHPLARMALALADLHEGRLADADARLGSLERDGALGAVNTSIVLGMIGDLRDAQGRPAEAFAAYGACNAEMRRVHQPRFEAAGAPSALAQTERLRRWFEAALREPWQGAPPARPRAADPSVHVFLVGFPRSGTTLLENVLAAHPDVVSLEERDCLAGAIVDYLHAEGGLERLASIGAGEALKRRDDYWKSVRGFGVEPRGRVFIDKMPLASINLPLIAKLFPGAKVLFARRDPRDVVLSCFRRRFGMNRSMYQLLKLEGAGAYYASVMGLVELYRQILPLELHEVRYEALVEDFEGVAGAACRFLGLQWDDGMREFAARARTRSIDTPSAAQVARGLNREGVGAWRRYREQLQPVLPTLQPWVERFGYPAQ